MLYPDLNELIALKNKANGLLLSSNRAVTSAVSGDYLSPFRGQGLEFEEVREYVAGDDIRSIDWRVTARTGKAHTKIFKEERERSVILCIDIRHNMRFGTRNTFKSVQAARVAALLGWQANYSRNRLGACLFGDIKNGTLFISPKRSRKSLWQMLKQLSNKKINNHKEKVSLKETLRHLNKAAPTGSVVYIISDFYKLNEDLEHQLYNLQKRCSVILITIDDIADKYIPQIGEITFSNYKENLNIDTNNSKASKLYTDNWQKTRDKLNKIANKNAINIININTDDDAFNTLAKGLNNIAKKGLSR